MRYALCAPRSLTIVLDVDSFDNKNHSLGDVSGKVGAALKAARDDDGVHCSIYRFDFLNHIIDEMFEDLQVKLICLVIRLANFGGLAGFSIVES